MEDRLGTHRGHKVAAAVAAAASVVVRVCRCRKHRKGRRRWPAWAVAVRKTRCYTAHRDGDGGDGAGGVAAVAATDGDPDRTNRAVACWTRRSEARTTDAEPLAAAKAAPPTPTTTRAVAMKASVSRTQQTILENNHYSSRAHDLDER